LQESSPALRAKLGETLHEHISSGRATLARVAQTLLSATDPEERPSAAIHRACESETPVIVFANEFFDALPVEILSPRGKLHLAFEASQLTEIWLPPTAEELEFLDRYSVQAEAHERIEVPLAAQRWMAEIATAVRQGFLLVIDYGYTRSEQLAGRHRGTLMAYRQHSASPNPYQAPGEQDLTAHVNFTALTAAAEQAGMLPQKFVTQSQFLMGIGERTQFADAFEQCRLPQERAKVALQLKHLVSPIGMGETFQVLLASRGVEPDRTAALSGLRFGR
jgi:SAM-dependent MidA family methyltransferase